MKPPKEFISLSPSLSLSLFLSFSLSQTQTHTHAHTHRHTHTHTSQCLIWTVAPSYFYIYTSCHDWSAVWRWKIKLGLKFSLKLSLIICYATICGNVHVYNRVQTLWTPSGRDCQKKHKVLSPDVVRQRFAWATSFWAQLEKGLHASVLNKQISFLILSSSAASLSEMLCFSFPSL